MNISPILGLTPIERVISTIIITTGTVAVIRAAFALLKGYSPLVGGGNPLMINAVMILGGSAMVVLPVVTNITDYNRHKNAFVDSNEIEKLTEAWRQARARERAAWERINNEEPELADTSDAAAEN